jgi:hypothetical protein
MSVLELKQEITRLSQRDRQEVHAFLVRFKHESPEWRHSAARRIRSMKKGWGVTVEELKARIRG